MTAIKMGLVASAESVANIISGVTKVGDADKLDGNDSSYFATKASVTNITNGTTTVPKADTVDGKHASDFVLLTTAKESGFFADMLSATKITTDYTIEDLLNKQSVTFFTNWSDSTNFPSLYGSGIVLTALDSTNRYVYYSSGKETYYAYAKNANGTWTLTWKKLSDADTLDGKHASDFLPITGGTLSQPNSVVLNIHNTAANSLYSLLYFYANSVGLGALGFMGANNPILYTTDGAAKGLLHEGNSSKVIVSTTAPADTTAVWIVPN
jgi:hypothetical protein